MNAWEQANGSPFSIGVSWNPERSALNFALYSRHATVVRVLLYSPDDLVHPVVEVELDYLENKSGPIWHCRIPCEPTDPLAYYAYRVDGPAPTGGYDFHDFDFEKILLDPMAVGEMALTNIVGIRDGKVTKTCHRR